MRRRRLVGTASAVAMAATAGVASVAWAEPAVPTFVNGLSQPVFAQGSANWVNHELWVETDMDTDGDGRRDRVHVDVSRPMETVTDGLEVPVVYEDSPYYAGGADITNWAVDHEIGERPATRPRAPHFPAVVEVPATMTGSVPGTLGLTLGPPASFGAFRPGLERAYEAPMSANVVSTAGEARLTVADGSGVHTGRRVNGSFALAQPLQIGANGSALAPVGDAANPTTLLSYAGPVSNDAVDLRFRQSIGAREGLRTGVYSKTLTFTLSTTQP